MEEEVMVDTQGFLTTCPQFGRQAVQVPMPDCEQCKYHVRIEEVWPGKDDAAIIVKAAEMTDETFINNDNVDTGKHRLYDRICGLPTRARTSMMIKLVPKMER